MQPAAEHVPAPVAEPLSSRWPPGRLKRHHLVLLILILAVAGMLRVYQLGRQSLWFDEFLTLQESGGWGFAHEAIFEGVVFETLLDGTSVGRGWPWWSVWSAVCWDSEA